MSSCPNCNVEVHEDDIFCSNCGLKLNIKPLKVDDIDTSIPDDLLNRYVKLDSQLSELEGIDQEVSEVEKFHSSLVQERINASNLYQKRNRDANLEYKDVDALKSLTWTSLKARFSGDRDEKLKKEELEYFNASKLANEAKQDLDEISKRLESVYNQLDELKRTQSKKKVIENRLNELLDEIYGGSSGSHLENQKEKEIENMKTKLIPLRNQIITLNSCLGHLINAKDHFNNALRELGSAKGYSDWDTFFGGGLIADSMKRNRTSSARNYVAQGQYSLERASNSCKNLTQIEIPVIEEGSFVWDTLFDNFFSDMNARERIRNSARSVENTLYEVSSVISGFQNKIRGLETEISNQQQQIFHKKKELDSIRKSLIESYLKESD